MLRRVTRIVWKATRWIVGTILAILIGYAANLAVLQGTDIHSTAFIGLVNWLFLPGMNRIITLSVLIPFSVITLLSGILVKTEQGNTLSALKLQGKYRSLMLDKVRAKWITGVFEKSLYGTALIVLDLKEQEDAIADPWRLAFQQPNQPEYLLPAGTCITKAYDEAGGELLILGEPGSGKTTLLLELTRDLLDRAKQDNELQIPVVFNLSSWATAKQRSLAEWIVEELNTKYQIRRELGQKWVDQDQILPLLDGLDEVEINARSACINAINTYRQMYTVPTVVCSRTLEYWAQAKRVVLRSAVVVQPLTALQINDYLSNAGGKLDAIRVALSEDEGLQELATTPLMLNILALAYRGMSANDLLEKHSLDERRRQAFETYINRVLQSRGIKNRYTSQQAIGWLSWLAKQLTQQGQTEFYIEQIQPEWLQDSRFCSLYHLLAFRLWNALSFGLISGLITCLIFLLAAGVVGGRGDAPLGGLFYGLLTGLLFGFFHESRPLDSKNNGEIKLVEVVHWSWESFYLDKDVLGRLGCLVEGCVLPTVLVFVSGFGFAFGLSRSLIIWLFLLLAGYLGSGLVGGMARERIGLHKLVKPYRGVQRSLQNGILVGLLSGLVIGIVIGLITVLLTSMLHGQSFGLALGVNSAIIFGLMSGLLLGFTNGGIAFIQHFILSLFLWQTSCTPPPWRYVGFLDYATDCVLLRKVGGGYIFVHRLLRDYFAELSEGQGKYQAKVSHNWQE